jgi:hypothetical protein
VREWLDTEPNREQREIKFACSLAEDFNMMWHDSSHDENDETQLVGQLALLASRYTNWRSIARRLLKRFQEPAMFAVPNVVPEGYSTYHWN